MPLFQEAFSGKQSVCCTLIVQYNICSTVDWSIASIHDLSAHIYLGALRLGKYSISGYHGCGGTYHVSHAKNFIIHSQSLTSRLEMVL